jgi:hypothetical protein
MRTRSEAEIRVWSAPGTETLPGLRAVVTTRAGGHSAAPYDSLNLGLSTGDDPEHVHANRDRLRRALQIEDRPLHVLHQVHGDRIWPALDPRAQEGDGLWTDRAGVVLVVGIADCTPVFVWDARRGSLMLLHAGWRGTAAGIVRRGIELLRAHGSSADDLHLALGPCIGPCCYPVSVEVANQFPTAAVTWRDRTPLLDLRAANRLQALDAGVAPERICAAPPCTGCESETFFSHRKQGPRSGRMWALLWRNSAGDHIDPLESQS